MPDFDEKEIKITKNKNGELIGEYDGIKVSGYNEEEIKKRIKAHLKLKNRLKKEQILRKKIREIIVEKLLIEMEAPKVNSDSDLQQTGLTDLTARRAIQLRARESAFDFEKQIIKGFNLKDPDKMDGNSQKLYEQAAIKLERLIIKAVLEVIPEFAILPKEEEEETKTETKPQISSIPKI
jgi:hypothetical protein